MQAAVDIVGTSPHPTNKIAAALTIGDHLIAKTNTWPDIIAHKIGAGVEIGNSSGTVHAEMNCIFQAMHKSLPTQGANMFITDPPCPNCMKNLAEAGIAKLYIDHKGFDKDWSKRRGGDFETMSMRVAAKAGIDVYVIYRKEQKFEIISTHPPGYKPANENPAIIEPNLKIDKAIEICGDEPFALALAKSTSDKSVSILSTRHPTIGYTHETIEDKDGKYSFFLEPLNRLLMIVAREGLQLDQSTIYSSRIPTSREFVNFIGAGFTHLQIGDSKTARDNFGPLALDQLVKAGILDIQHKT